MGTKRRLNPLAQALVLIDTLSDEEQKTVIDYLRGKHKAPRKPAVKKTEKVKTGITAVRLPDNPEGFLKGATA